MFAQRYYKTRSLTCLSLEPLTGWRSRASSAPARWPDLMKALESCRNFLNSGDASLLAGSVALASASGAAFPLTLLLVHAEVSVPCESRRSRQEAARATTPHEYLHRPTTSSTAARRTAGGILLSPSPMVSVLTEIETRFVEPFLFRGEVL